MQYGICLLSIVPCRKEPDSRSEMVTQLLFGEQYSIVEITESWISIITAYDNYPCWINARQHSRLSENVFHELQKQPAVYSSELVQVIHNTASSVSFPISLGASLPFFKSRLASVETFRFDFDGQTCIAGEKKTIPELISTAFLFLNAPYLWGGKSPFGVDCSGFTQLVYKLSGYKLPRDAAQQVELGTPLSFVEEAEAGDLAFFDNEEGKIVHVGILLNNEQIIHASGFVRIDRFDHYGIFGSDAKKYSHTLRVIKRLIQR